MMILPFLYACTYLALLFALILLIAVVLHSVGDNS